MENRLVGIELKDIMHYLYQDTLVPELFSFLGEELAIEFVQIFGGTKINVPSWKKVMDLQRNLEIFEEMCFASSAATVKRMAAKYDITEVWVRRIYALMRSEVPKIMKFLENSEESPIKITTARRPKNAKEKSK